jgi:N-acetylglucosaminyldiphosphoundecaprenol N-acetyl-beta-D-mannosaminyltransferase
MTAARLAADEGRQHTTSDSCTVEILGIPVSAIDMADALATIRGWIAGRQQQYVCVNTVNSVLAAFDDPQLAEVYENAGLVTPDGMPLVWISRARGHSRVRRVYGPDLMLACCDQLREHGVRHYLYGGADGVPELLAERLVSRFPGLEVVGAYSPPFRALTEEERARDIERINKTSPDIVWVGLGAPKQDHWMSLNREHIEAPVLIGVGAAFDFHAGVKRQAPIWMRRTGLEWLFRLLSEPGRLAGRYIVGNSRFLRLIITEEFRRRTARV